MISTVCITSQSESEVNRIANAICKGNLDELSEILTHDLSIPLKTIKIAFNKIIEDLNKSGHIGDLYQAKELALIGMENRIHFNNKLFITGVETLLNNLFHEGEVEQVISLLHLAILKKAKLSKKVVHYITSGLANSISRPEELEPYCELLKVMVYKDTLELDNERVKFLYDIVLAGLSEYQLGNNGDIKSRLNADRNEMDACRRLGFAAEVTYELLESDIRFDHPNNKSRLNMTIRGLFSGAFALIDQIKKSELILTNPGIVPPSLIHSKSIQLKFPYPDRSLSEKQITERLAMAEELTLIALMLTNKVLEQKIVDNENNVNIVKGITIKNLFLCFDCCAYDTNLEFFEIGASILSNAVSIPRIKDSLRLQDINAIIRTLYTKSREEDSSVTLPTLVGLIKKVSENGFIVDGNLKRKIFEEYLIVNGFYEEHSDYIYSNEKSETKEEKPLRGGVGDEYLSSEKTNLF
jgi:hypothetical protein